MCVYVSNRRQRDTHYESRKYTQLLRVRSKKSPPQTSQVFIVTHTQTLEACKIDVTLLITIPDTSNLIRMLTILL